MVLKDLFDIIKGSFFKFVGIIVFAVFLLLVLVFGLGLIGIIIFLVLLGSVLFFVRRKISAFFKPKKEEKEMQDFIEAEYKVRD